MKTALVTGAGSRIGSAIAEALGQSGFYVYVHYKSSPDGADEVVARIIRAGGRAEKIYADLGNLDEVRGLASFVREKEISLLVNNASVFVYDDPVDFDPDTLVANFVVNAVAPALLAKAIYDTAKENEDSVVINILDSKLFSMNPDYFSYTTGKYALSGITEMMSMRFVPLVRVCGIAPGITLPSGAQTKAEFEKAHVANPLRNGCTPDQIVDAIKFIIDVKSFNNQVIKLDGGQHLLKLPRDVHFMVNES